jgi:hypothetical protein
MVDEIVTNAPLIVLILDADEKIVSLIPAKKAPSEMIRKLLSIDRECTSLIAEMYDSESCTSQLIHNEPYLRRGKKQIFFSLVPPLHDSKTGMQWIKSEQKKLLEQKMKKMIQLSNIEKELKVPDLPQKKAV